MITYILTVLVCMLLWLMTLMTQPPVCWNYSHAPTVYVWKVCRSESQNKDSKFIPRRACSQAWKRLTLSVCDLVAREKESLVLQRRQHNLALDNIKFTISLTKFKSLHYTAGKGEQRGGNETIKTYSEMIGLGD